MFSFSSPIFPFFCRINLIVAHFFFLYCTTIALDALNVCRTKIQIIQTQTITYTNGEFGVHSKTNKRTRKKHNPFGYINYVSHKIRRFPHSGTIELLKKNRRKTKKNELSLYQFFHSTLFHRMRFSISSNFFFIRFSMCYIYVQMFKKVRKKLY